MAIAILGGGCFWCTEAVFKRLKGVTSVLPGYCGGHIEQPSYEQVKSKTTGHIEVIKIDFDPEIISFEDLLEVFFNTHDPTTLDKQGLDEGPQYASVIFAQNDEQERIARDIMTAQQKNFAEPIVTKVLPAAKFWTAEEYHHNFFDSNPEQHYCSLVISKKVAKFMEKYADKLKDAG